MMRKTAKIGRAKPMRSHGGVPCFWQWTLAILAREITGTRLTLDKLI